MKSICILTVLFICAFARLPFLDHMMTTTEVKEGTFYWGQIANDTFYPFQRTVIVNQNIPTYSMKVTYNTTELAINAQFLKMDKEGEMVPTFTTPLNGTVVTTRLHSMPCYPQQGGTYYRHDTSIEYGDVNNEVVGTKVTDANGYINMTIYRPWTTRIEDAKSIVLNTADEGIILCTNLYWEEVDGALSSAVKLTTLLAVVGLVMKQIFSCICLSTQGLKSNHLI